QGSRLKRHATNRAVTRLIAHDFRMHGTGVFTLRVALMQWACLTARKVFARTRLELPEARGTAEVIGGPAVFSGASRGLRGDCHAADRINGLGYIFPGRGRLVWMLVPHADLYRNLCGRISTLQA